MIDLTGYISYRQAKFNLDNRLQTSEEEIALWVSGIAGDKSYLNAYIIGFSGLIPFLANGHMPFGGDDYICPLEGLYFKPAEVEQFEPSKRFISWLALIERWKKYNNDDKGKTINLINKSLGLIEYHPVNGTPDESNGEGFERGLFDLSIVMKIELQLDSTLKPIEQQAEANGSGRTKKRDDAATLWMNEFKPDIQAMTSTEIHMALIATNRELWQKGFADWNRQQTVWPKKSAGSKKGK